MKNADDTNVVTKETDAVIWTVRMPKDQVEFLDQEAVRRGELAGVKVSRTAALLALVRDAQRRSQTPPVSAPKPAAPKVAKQPDLVPGEEPDEPSELQLRKWANSLFKQGVSVDHELETYLKKHKVISGRGNPISSKDVNAWRLGKRSWASFPERLERAQEYLRQRKV